MREAITVHLPLFWLPLVMIVAGCWDVLTLRIPNSLNLILIGSFFPVAVAAGLPVWMIGQHIATFVSLLCLGFVMFSFRLFGGGDAKLMASAGLWLGFPSCLDFMMFTALAGGVLALAARFIFLGATEVQVNHDRFSHLVPKSKPQVPYGFALAAGAILALPSSFWMNAAGSAA